MWYLNDPVALLQLDSTPKTITVGNGNTKELQLAGDVFLAGLDYPTNVTVHPGVYTATLRRGFRGCLSDVKVDGELVWSAVFLHVPWFTTRNEWHRCLRHPSGYQLPPNQWHSATVSRCCMRYFSKRHKSSGQISASGVYVKGKLGRAANLNLH